MIRKISSLITKRPMSDLYADKTFLPFLLLAESTFLPPGVAILARKPWTLDLDLFLGWNVIFISVTPHFLYYISITSIYKNTTEIITKEKPAVKHKIRLFAEVAIIKILYLFYNSRCGRLIKLISTICGNKHKFVFKNHIYIILSTFCGKIVYNSSDF